MTKTQLIKGITNALKAVAFTEPARYFQGLTGFSKNMLAPATDKESLLGAYKYWVYAGVSAIARNEAKVNQNLYYKKGSGEEWEEIHDHPYLLLMKNPNPEMSCFELRELRTLHLSLTGDAYWYLVMNKSFGKPLPVEIYPLLPHRVRILPGKAGGIVGGYKYRMENNDEIEFSPAEIVHFRLPNPSDLFFYGYSPLSAMVYTVNLDEIMRQFLWEIFQNGAIPGTALYTEKILDDPVRERIYQDWSKFEGVKNVGKTVLLDGGLKAEKLGFTLQELSFPEGSKRMMDEILAVIGTPKTKLGIGDTINKATAFALEQTFQSETIHPILLRNASKENQRIVTLYDERLEVEYDNPVPADRELELKEWDTWLRNYVFSVDEYRDYLGADTPSGWGDKPLASMSIYPLEMERDFSYGLEPVKAVPFSKTKKAQKGIKQNTRYQERKLLMRRKNEDRLARAYKSLLSKFFNEQRRQVMANMRRLGMKDIQPVTKAIADFILLSVETEAARLTKLSAPALIQGLAYGIDTAGKEIGKEPIPAESGGDNGKSGGKAGDKAVIKTEFVNRVDINLGIYNDFAIQYVNEWHFKFSFPISEGMQADLRAAIEVAISQGESIAELQERVARIFDLAEDYRAERISRTEMARSICEGELKIYEDAGIETKMWLVADAEVCDECLELANETVNIREPFSSGDDAPPLHPNSLMKDVDIYTQEGWANVKTLKIGDKCLSLNPDTFDLEYMNVIKTYKHKEEKMISFKSRNFDIVVTPDHNMFYQTDWDGRKNPNKWKFIKASELLEVDAGRMYRSSLWRGDSIVEYMAIGVNSIPIEVFCQFMGFYLSEGSITKCSKGNKWQISISQSQSKNPDKYELIKEVLLSMPVKWWIGKDKFHTTDKDLCEYVNQFGKNDKKHVPEIIKSLIPEKIRIFLNAYCIGDGNIQKGKNWKSGKFRDSITYFTVSKRMADDLGELILKTGRRPSYRLQKSKGKLVKHKNGYYAGNYDVWHISECYSQYAYIDSLQIKEKDYNDLAYCVELEKNHTLWIRRNGKTVWSGNCRCDIIAGEFAER